MAIGTDILIDYTNKRIYGETSFLASSTFYTANELYTYIMDTMDEANQMDDTVPFTSTSNILNYTVGNGWYIQQDLLKHIKGASILTDGYEDTIRIISFSSSGYTPFVSGDIGKLVSGVVTNDTASLLDYNNTSRKLWCRMTGSGDLFNNASEIVKTVSGTGSGTMNAISVTGEEIFSNIYSVGTIVSGNAYIYQNGAVLSGWWGSGNNGNHIDVLVKVKEGGSLIDAGTLIVYNRNFSTTYDHASVTVAAGGRTPVPLATQVDISTTLTSAQTAAYVATAYGGTGATSQISGLFGNFTADIDDNSSNETYNCQIDCDSQAMSIVYQALQYMCSKDRSGYTLNGTDSRAYTSASGSFTPVKSAPFATMAGTTLIFAQGVYPINVGAGSYIATDISGVQHTPPNTMSIAITGLVSGDFGSVFLTENSSVKKNQFTSHASNNASGLLTFEIQENIPKDTPTTGYLRTVDVSTVTEQRYAYTSWTGKIFTLSSALDRAYVASDTAYVGYLDERSVTTSLSKTVQYVSDRAVVVRVRNSSSGGNQIIPFEVAATISSTGLSVPASRNPDYVISN